MAITLYFYGVPLDHYEGGMACLEFNPIAAAFQGVGMDDGWMGWCKGLGWMDWVEAAKFNSRAQRCQSHCPAVDR
ncbi:hypothetical protein E5D57_010119 [Metarhizium anisopliae]|nr:hypothetical protein E5D57_010119 [Metarhizium anisopliae]